MTKKITNLMLNGENYEIREYQGGGGGGWQPSADTVAYYPLEDDTLDHSINGYDITSLNNTQLTTFNGVKCLDLNTSYAAISSIDDLNSESEWTMSFWTYLTASSGVSVCYHEGGTWGGSGVLVGETTTRVYARWGNPTNCDSYTTGPNSGEWVHVVLTVKNGHGSVYLNTTPKTLLSNGALGPVNNATTLYLGAWTDINNIYGSGYLSKVIIENKGWSNSDVFDYYNLTCADYGLSPKNPVWSPDSNTRLWLKLAGDMDDYSGEGNNGAGSDVTYGTSGSLTYGIFNGSSSYILANNTLTISNYAASAWVQLKSVPNGAVYALITNGTGNNMQSLTVIKAPDSNNKLIFKSQYWVGSPSYCPPAYIAPDSLVLTTDTWYHICSVRIGTTCYLYVNGESAYSGTITNELRTEQWSIGAQQFSSQCFFDGYISNVIVEEGGWSEQDVANYYNATKSLYGIS